MNTVQMSHGIKYDKQSSSSPIEIHLHMAAHMLRLNHMAADRQALCSESATVLTN